jgi:hypothetical protein
MGWRRTEELLAAGRDSGSVFLDALRSERMTRDEGTPGD